MAQDEQLQSFRVAPAEKEAIYLARFAEGKSVTQLAEEFKRDRNTISRVLGTKEAAERCEQILDAIGQEAKAKLRRAAGRAADSWITQLENANRGERAQHLPAKELLTHSGVLDVAAPNVDRSTQVLIQIGGKGIPEEPVEVEEPDPVAQLPAKPG